MNEPRAVCLLRVFPAVAAATPPVLILVGACVMVLAALAGSHPLWPSPVLTMAEAAALRDTATLVQRIEAGADPNAPAVVRAGVVYERPVALRPIEAAAATGRLDVMELLLTRGARLDGHSRRTATCIAAERSEQQVVEFLQRGAAAPIDVHAECRQIWAELVVSVPPTEQR